MDSTLRTGARWLDAIDVAYAPYTHLEQWIRATFEVLAHLIHAPVGGLSLFAFPSSSAARLIAMSGTPTIAESLAIVARSAALMDERTIKAFHFPGRVLKA